MAAGRMTRRNQAFLNNRNAKERPGPHRALVGAATSLKLDDKIEARRLRVLRQGWQEDAMSYVDALPELDFAYRFQTNSASRMRWFPAMTNPDDPAGPPVAFEEVDSGFRPPGWVQEACTAALDALGTGGRQAVRPIQESLRWNLGVPGECYVVGTEDDLGNQEWSVRSIDEFVVVEDQYKMRDVPLDPQGVLGWIDVDPAKTYAARLWVPHPRYKKLARSPMRSLLDVAEELLLLSRDVRSTARSRLAGAGILKIPEGLRMMSFLEDNSGDPQSEEWFGRFAEAMTTPISDDGVASAVVPIAISGEATALAGLDHMLIERPYSAMAMELRAEAIGRLATGVDVPREVLEGMSDPNHWGAWLVSDDTFRHHLEPQAITDVDCFSAGYLRPWMVAAAKRWGIGQPEAQQWIGRVCIWYDPTELITKPDPAANAILAHDRMALSNKALCEALGFSEDDLPTALEMEVRMITKFRSFPPNVTEALIHALDPDLEIPPIGQSGTVPGMGPHGAIPATPPGIVAGPPTEPPSTTDHGPATPTGGTPTAPTTASPPAAPSGTPALPPAPTGATAEPEPFAAQTTPQGPTATEVRLSRALADIDRDVRTRVQQAACASVMRLLDRAGAKLRTKASDRRFGKAYGQGHDVAALRQAIKDVPNRKVAAVLGQQAVTALGYATSSALLDPGYEELEAQFNAWVRGAQLQAVRTACKLSGTSPTSKAARDTEARLADALPVAWQHFRDALDTIGARLVHNPDPNADDELSLNPNTVVPTGVVRAALAIAGGADPKPITADSAQDSTVAERYPTGTGEDKSNIEGETSGEGHVLVDAPDGQIGSGDAVGDLLDQSGMETASFVWAHGPSLHPFEPHLDLDGTEFTSFSDDALANTEGFPDNEFFFPGDHDGCSCDFMTIWTTGGGDDTGTGDEDTGDTGEEAPDTATDDTGSPVDLSALVSDWSQSLVDSLTGDAGPASQAAAWRDLDAAKASVMDEVTQARVDAEEVLNRMGVPDGIARPDRGDTAAEYDWYRQLSTSERDRLRNGGWVTDTSRIAPDQAAMSSHESVDAAMAEFLDATRTIDAAHLVEGGRALSANIEARFGGWEFDNLAPTSPYKIDVLFGERRAAADYVASQRTGMAAEQVERVLTGRFGSPIYAMSYDDYEAEVLRLSDTIASATPISSSEEFGDVFSPEVTAAENRFYELLPDEMMPPGDEEPDLAAIWNEATQIARLAGLGQQ